MGTTSMNKTTAILIALLGCVILGCITFLLATDHDVNSLVSAIPGVLAAVAAIAGYDKAKNAETNSATTVTQTNGRLTELIESNKTLAQAINDNPGIPVAAAISDAGTNPLTTSTLPTEGTTNAQPAG